MQLKNEQASFVSHWRELNDYVRPRRGRFFTSDRNRGDRRTQKIIDSTATLAARTLSAGMMSGLTSPARPWFRLTTSDPGLAESGDVKEWLYYVTQRLGTIFLRSNLYNVLPIMYSDLSVFGTAAFGVFEDLKDVIRCTSYPIGSYMIANDEREVANVFMRDFEMTVRQIVMKFVQQPDDTMDWGAASRRVKELWDRGQTEAWIPVAQVVTPNDEYHSGVTLSKFKEFRSCYWETGTREDDRFLDEAGFDEFPVLAARWETTGEDIYGTDCPGMTALGDIKQLQLGERRALQAVEKSVNPPMVAPPGMRNSKLTILPGEVSYVQEAANQSFRPAHEVNFDLQKLELKQGQARARIQRAFYEDLFLMMTELDRREITAREVQERHEEKLLVLGPVLERLNQDVYDRLIDRAFGIAYRRGFIPPPPERLQDEPLKVEYISLMAQAQKSVMLGGLERFAQDVMQIASVDPSVLDVIDRDAMIRELAESTGVPPHLTLPEETVAETRAARAQAAQQQQMAENMKQLGVGAKNLAAADTTKKSALTDLLGVAAPTEEMMQ
ncbi:MAG TPA: portal protein [Gemmatimonadaceae bacterium]|nr:portal protein [Gemmatimonadaceae bacterium]